MMNRNDEAHHWPSFCAKIRRPGDRVRGGKVALTARGIFLKEGSSSVEGETPRLAGGLKTKAIKRK